MSKSKLDPRTLFLMGNKMSPDSSDSDTTESSETVSSSSTESSSSTVSSSSSESSESRRDRGDIIYILKLKGDKYYVGTTQNFTVRLKQHESGVDSAAWVVLHGYDSIVRTFAYAHKLDEDNEVKKMMMEYGIHNVRGGSYSNVKLTVAQTKTLEREFGHARGQCFKCGSKDHYAKNCTVKEKTASKKQETKAVVYREKITVTKEKTSRTIIVKDSKVTTAKEKKKPCKRCGRTGHTKTGCYAKTLLCGTNIADLKYCCRCGREDHSKNNYTSFTCTYKTDRDRVKLSSSSSSFCVKCGRDSHTLDKCYAGTKHTGGKL